ncbi:branched-chain amino acid ABC transporter substrate-binding protein [Caldilinea sp.]|uniref:branched-chain amino acid ABC transporter substrate-binding protein n=1 Tax=Caldilinea sp. TaxID=2293560 RepID=UPI0021DCA9A4|nr:branched-chain amino acid ABC transporter substrate-binding protein [Caldilinea sp.]GIV70676.1 MAG: branched chain amino acid ABC transporter substrate-binding protein [Caldilinea sp.]
MNKRLLWMLLLLLFAMIAAGCNRNAGPTRGDVIVYVAVPLSGFQANGGQTVLGGVRLAAAEINNAGGLLGYRVVVRPLDDESDSEVAVEQAETIRQAIANGERVLAVIGHLNSGQTLAAMEVYKDLPLVVISATASEQSLTERNYDNFFRVNANDAVQAKVCADFLVDRLKATSVAVLHNDTEYGRGLATSLIENLQQRGVGVAVRIEVQEGQSIYTDEVAKIRAAAPDAIFYAGYEIEAPYLRAALVEAGVTAPMLASDGAFLAATIDEANGAAEGMYVTAFAPSPRNVADSRWIEAYQAVEYRNPDTYSVNGYVAMQVLAEAVRKANAFERNAVTNSLRSERFDSLLGPLRFEPDGDLVDPKIWVYQVVNSEFVQVEN